MTATAHLTWIPDVIESLATSPSAVSDLRAYLAAPSPDTAVELAWTLNGLTSSHPSNHRSGQAGGPGIGPLQAAVTVLRHEVDKLPPEQLHISQAARDLVYLLTGLTTVRLNAGRPEAAIRAADEAIARLTAITESEAPPAPEDMDLLGDLLALRSSAKQSITIDRPNESAVPVTPALLHPRMGTNADTPRIDTTFDFRTDTPPGEDPDTHSPTLRRYHQFLWSKPLPNGTPFNLTTDHPGRYLHHSSALGDFALSSDSVIPSYRTWQCMAHITSQVPGARLDEFQAVGHSIGGMMVFPATRRQGTQTINQARGTLAAIGDRMDLTLDCIREHYAGGTSPLAATLSNYADFFALFGSLDGYVHFFHLEDLIEGAPSATETIPADAPIAYLHPHPGWEASPLPASVDEYLAYGERSLTFLRARNERIDACCTPKAQAL